MSNGRILKVRELFCKNTRIALQINEGGRGGLGEENTTGSSAAEMSCFDQSQVRKGIVN
jgi:hypothetical protein